MTSERNHLIARIIFSVILVAMIAITTAFKNDQIDIIEDHECIIDYPFEWTEEQNQFFVDNEIWKDFMIIKSSVGIDFVLITFLPIYFIWGGTWRLPSALGFFYPVRNVIQAIFLMGRLDGFLWSHPGIMSLTVPYFDTNDFYFSGHTGSMVMYASEFLAMRWYKWAIIPIVVVIDVLAVMVLLRTHYIIDFTSGYVWARLAHRWGEKICYYPDVKISGYPREKRFSLNYDPCPRCGWGNEAVLRLTTRQEKEF